MKNVFKLLLLLIIIQGCQVAEEEAAEKEEVPCNPVLGCAWEPAIENLEHELCYQDLAEDFIAKGYDCELIEDDYSNYIFCDQPEGLSEQTATDDSLDLLIKLTNEYGWTIVKKNTPLTPRFQVSNGAEWASRPGKITSGIATVDPTNIKIKDCTEDSN